MLGLGAPVALDASEVAVLRPVQAGVNELRLRFRLDLRAGIAAGTYELPLVVRAAQR